MIKVTFAAGFDYGLATKSQRNNALGKTVHQMSYEIQVVFGDKGNNLTFKAVMNGKVVSTADIEFNRR